MVSSIASPAEGVLEDVSPPDMTADASRSDASAAEPGAESDEAIVAREEVTSVEDSVVVSSIASPAEGVLADVSPPEMTAEDSRSDASAAEPGAESGASSEGARNDEAIVAREEGTSVDSWFRATASPAEGVLEDASAPDVTADASRSDASAAEPGAESGASSEGARNDEAIVVWRPERRAPAHRGAGRRTQRDRNELPPGEHSRVGAPGRSDNVGRSPAPAPKRMRNKNRSEAPSAIAAADARKAAERPPPRPDRSDNVARRQKASPSGHQVVICPALIQGRGSSLGRKSTRTPHSPSFSSSDRYWRDKPTSDLSVARHGWLYRTRRMK